MNQQVQPVPDGREVARCDPPGEEVARQQPGAVDSDMVRLVPGSVDGVQQQNAQCQALSLQVTLQLTFFVHLLAFGVGVLSLNVPLY